MPRSRETGDESQQPKKLKAEHLPGNIAERVGPLSMGAWSDVPPRLTLKNTPSFKVLPEGSAFFSAGDGTFKEANNKIRDGVSARAESAGYASFGIALAIEEFMVNAARHGCHRDPKKNITVRWAVGGSETRFSITNPAESIFDPTKKLFRSGKRVAQEQEASNPHVGTQLIIWYSDSIEYEWPLKGGDKVRLTVDKVPGTDMDAYLKYRSNTQRRWRWVSEGGEKPMRNYDAVEAELEKRGLKPETFTVSTTFKKQKLT